MIVRDAGGSMGRRPAEPETRALSGLPESLDAGVYLVDDQGRIVAANSRLQELLGRSAESLVGREAHNLLHRNSRGQTLPRTQCAMMHGFLSGRTAQGSHEWFECGDGSLIRVSWLITPCRLDETVQGAMVLVYEPVPEGAAPRKPSYSTEPLSEIDRLALLAETTTLLTSTLDVDEALRRLVRLVVPRLADWAVVDLITEKDEVWRSAVVHHEDGTLANRAELEGPMPPVPQESPMPLSRALRGAASSLAGPETYQGPPDSGIAVVQRELFKATGMHSAAIAPIRGLREVLGALTLGRSERPGAFADTELSLLDDIARRAGLALDNARLYQRQQRVAETMQRHLLPQLPDVSGLEMTARYVPAPHASQVGGDWYDAFVLSDGATALVVGDVVGHDLDAAAGMAQVRNMLRAYAWAHQEPPSAIVTRLDQAVVNIAEVSMATMVFARMEESADGQWRLHWTNAGHPPPLLVSYDGQVRFLDEEHNLLLGTELAPGRTDIATALPPLSTLVLYTDGLIESPGHSLDEGMARLRQHAAALAHRPLDAFCDLLLDRVRPTDNEDDVALLAVRVPVPG